MTIVVEFTFYFCEHRPMNLNYSSLVVGPLLLEMGVHPLVGVATSSFTVLLTGSSTAIQFLIMGVVSWDYFCKYLLMFLDVVIKF